MNNLQDMLRDIDQEVAMTKRYIGKDALDARVIDAMAQVPREQFLPEETRFLAFQNGPAAIGHGQTISQPYIVALMTDLLEIGPESTVLEVGTGSGYQAAVLSHLAKQVYSLEIIAPLAQLARERLQQLGYANVEVRHGDGYEGWAEHAPYDGIIVTAAAPHVPQPLVDQLKPGANLVIPVGRAGWHQELQVIHKGHDGKISIRDVLGVAFVPLTGRHCDLG
jgi:protein-L-isoaspartate(D-aspartate) O-methyltransferase